MKDLIAALEIFSKYSDDKYPTNCSHDELAVLVDPDSVSKEDIVKLEELGFFPKEDDYYFYSYRFGSA